MRVVLTGGATGGHVIPFEPIVDHLRTVWGEQRKSLPGWVDKRHLTIYFLGPLDKDSRIYLERLDVQAVNIAGGKLRRYPSWRTPSDLLWRLPVSIIKALWQMWLIMPDAVISKGGFGSLPVGLAAVFYRIPFLLHESDVNLGLSNKMLAGSASVITVGFEETKKNVAYYRNKTFLTGTPVRSFAEMGQAEAKISFGFDPHKPLLLVMGGSQGAKEINDILLRTLPALLEHMNVIHMAGANNMAAVRAEAKKALGNRIERNQYQIFGFAKEEMGRAMLAADVVVTRAGATSLAELAHLRKAVIIIPLQGAAQDHQRSNATAFERAGAARVIDPANLGPSLFKQNILTVIEQSDVRETLQSNIALLDRRRAAREIAELTFKLARGLVPRTGNGKSRS